MMTILFLNVTGNMWPVRTQLRLNIGVKAFLCAFILTALGTGLFEIFRTFQQPGAIIIAPYRFVSIEKLKYDISLWLRSAMLESKSSNNFYLGTIRTDIFGDLKAVRVLCIVPSEYFRDISNDWDQFEIVVGYPMPGTDDPISGSVWLSTENYRRRAKGLIGTQSPSPNWEYYSADNDTTANSRLRDIADGLKLAAVRES